MTNETSLTSGPTEVIQGAEITAGQQLIAPASCLRRYSPAIGLTLLGAVVGALVGYFALKPEYKSVGVINVRPLVPRILYSNEQNSALPFFDAFIASQVAQIQSRRVTGEAMLLPEWKALGRGLTPDAVANFEKHLNVKNPPKSPLIKVTFADGDPEAAAVAVKAIIQTYERFYNDSEAEAGTPTMNLLENRRIELSAKQNSINDQILAIANDFGSSSLQDVYEFKLSELNKVESQLRQAQIEAISGAPDVAKQQALRALYEDLKRELVDLGRKNLIIEKLRSDAQEARERLEETKNRIEQLNLERNVSGRVSIISYGDVPLEPDKDPRRRDGRRWARAG